MVAVPVESFAAAMGAPAIASAAGDWGSGLETGLQD
jgi:hypothetical protein